MHSQYSQILWNTIFIDFVQLVQKWNFDCFFLFFFSVVVFCLQTYSNIDLMAEFVMCNDDDSKTKSYS